MSNIPKEQDPFWEPTEDVLIGTSNLFLQSLSYCLDFEDTLNISDYKGQEEGHLKVKLEPCDNKGKPIDEEAFVDDPHELLNKPYHFKVLVCLTEWKPKFERDDFLIFFIDWIL